jgi:branched-chain amino acid transport system permease protein
MTLLRHLGAAIVLAVILGVLSVTLNPFRDYQMSQVALYVVAIAGLTVLVGLSGQISIGNGAFMAVGAYAAALLLMHLAWPLAAVLAASAAAGGLVGLAVGVAAARLRGPYLAGVTLLLAVALPTLASRFTGVFGGDQGLGVNISTPAFLGPTFPLTRWQAWIACAAALITLVLLANLGRSRIGRSWRAVRDHEAAAALAGLNVAALRVLAFVISAACAGLAGALLGITTTLVSPGSFTVTLSIALLAGAVLGGLGSLAGAVWGSLVIVLVPTYVTDVATSHGLSSSVAANIPVAAYGVVLIVVILLFPEGIQGAVRRFGGPAVPAAGDSFGSWRRRAPEPAGEHPDGGSVPSLRRRAPASEHSEEGTP